MSCEEMFVIVLVVLCLINMILGPSDPYDNW